MASNEDNHNARLIDRRLSAIQPTHREQARRLLELKHAQGCPASTRRHYADALHRLDSLIKSPSLDDLDRFDTPDPDRRP